MNCLGKERQGRTVFDLQGDGRAHAGREVWNIFLYSEEKGEKKAVRKNLADIPVCKQPVWKSNSS